MDTVGQFALRVFFCFGTFCPEVQKQKEHRMLLPMLCLFLASKCLCISAKINQFLCFGFGFVFEIVVNAFGDGVGRNITPENQRIKADVQILSLIHI